MFFVIAPELMLSSEHEQQLYKDFRTDRLSLEVTEFFQGSSENRQ